MNSHGCTASSCGIAPTICAVTARIAVAAIAPIGTVVRVEKNSPIADEAEKRYGTYAAIGEQPQQPLADRHLRAREQRDRSDREEHPDPTSVPTTTTVSVPTMQNAAAPRYFTSSRRTRPAGAISR